MNVLEFIAKSEWPAVAGLALWMCRKSLRGMLERVNPTKIDAWGLKAEFERRLGKVDELAPPSKAASKSPTLAMDEALPNLSAPVGDLTKPPEMRVLRAWNRLVRELGRTADKLGLRTNSALGERAINQKVAAVIGLTPDQIAAIDELEEVRNKVAHTTETFLTESEARRFESASARLLHLIEARSTNRGS